MQAVFCSTYLYFTAVTFKNGLQLTVDYIIIYLNGVHIMELLQLRYFCSAAKSENFSKTAAEFMVPQSTVSQTIKKLETELGISLFDRRGNRVFLNDSGRMFYLTVSRSLTEIDNACDTLREIADGSAGSISILIKTDRRFIAECIAKYKEKHPNIRFTVHHRTPSEPCHFDMIIDDREFIHPDMECHSLMRETLLIGVHGDNPLAKRKALTFNDIADKTFISMPNGNSLYRILNSIFQKNGKSPKIDIFCDDPYFIRKYIELKLGIAIWPTISWLETDHKNIKLIPLADEKLYREIFLFTESIELMTVAAKGFAEYLKESSKIACNG